LAAAKGPSADDATTGRPCESRVAVWALTVLNMIQDVNKTKMARPILK
jgi:hypothetical protein